MMKKMILEFMRYQFTLICTLIYLFIIYFFLGSESDNSDVDNDTNAEHIEDKDLMSEQVTDSCIL